MEKSGCSKLKLMIMNDEVCHVNYQTGPRLLMPIKNLIFQIPVHLGRGLEI